MCLAAVSAPALANPALDAWKSPGHVALMRHAIAPGTADPAGFSLRDCATQRNLSDEGRAQAVAAGNYLRERSAPRVDVYSSQWCRCLETARLLNFGEPTELPFLNSFYENWDGKEPQTRALKDWLKSSAAGAENPIMLVTHQVNISALTDIYPASGEVVVVKIDSDGSITTVGSFLPPWTPGENQLKNMETDPGVPGR